MRLVLFRTQTTGLRLELGIIGSAELGQTKGQIKMVMHRYCRISQYLTTTLIQIRLYISTYKRSGGPILVND